MTPSSQELESPGNPGQFTAGEIAEDWFKLQEDHTKLKKKYGLTRIRVGKF